MTFRSPGLSMRFSVPHVFCVVAGLQMVRPNACWCSAARALMQDEKPVWNRATVRQFPRDMMGGTLFAFKFDRAIAPAIFPARPEPALAGFIDFPPETFRQRAVTTAAVAGVATVFPATSAARKCPSKKDPAAVEAGALNRLILGLHRETSSRGVAPRAVRAAPRLSHVNYSGFGAAPCAS